MVHYCCMNVIYFQRKITGKKWHRPGHQTWNLTTFQTIPLWHTDFLDRSQSLSLLAMHSKCADTPNSGWVFRQHSTSETTRMYKFPFPILSVIAGTQQRKVSCTHERRTGPRNTHPSHSQIVGPRKKENPWNHRWGPHLTTRKNGNLYISFIPFKPYRSKLLHWPCLWVDFSPSWHSIMKRKAALTTSQIPRITTQMHAQRVFCSLQ